MLEQVSLVEATERQFSIAVNNAELLDLIRDQSENLGGLLREQQIRSDRSRAILESVADGVLVTDNAMQITLFNASAERILNLKAKDALGKPLETLIGLFGKSGRCRTGTIRRWSLRNRRPTSLGKRSPNRSTSTSNGSWRSIWRRCFSVTNF